MRGTVIGWWPAACRIQAGGEVCCLRLPCCGSTSQQTLGVAVRLFNTLSIAYMTLQQYTIFYRRNQPAILRAATPPFPLPYSMLPPHSVSSAYRRRIFLFLCVQVRLLPPSPTGHSRSISFPFSLFTFFMPFSCREAAPQDHVAGPGAL